VLVLAVVYQNALATNLVQTESKKKEEKTDFFSFNSSKTDFFLGKWLTFKSNNNLQINFINIVTSQTF
jgi:hypothetical protein